MTMDTRHGFIVKRRRRCASLAQLILALLLLLPAMGFAEKYDYQWAPHNGLIQVERDGKIGLINEAGEVVLAPQFDFIEPYFQSGYASVGVGGQRQGASLYGGLFGLIDKQGNIVLKPVYTDLGPLSEGLLYAADENHRYGYIDITGQWIIPPTYDSATDFVGDIATPVKKVDDIQYVYVINKKGEVLNTVPSSGSLNFSEGLPINYAAGDYISVEQNVSSPDFASSIVIISEMGDVISLDEWVSKSGLGEDDDGKTYFFAHGASERFSDGLMPVRKDHLYGYINRSGEVVIPLQFDDAGPFVDGRANVKLTQEDPKLGFHASIDTSGRIVGARRRSSLPEYLLPDGTPFTGDTNKLKKGTQLLTNPDQLDDKVAVYSYYAYGKEGNSDVVVDSERQYNLQVAFVSCETQEVLFPIAYGYKQKVIDGLYQVFISTDGQKKSKYTEGIGYLNASGEVVAGLKPFKK